MVSLSIQVRQVMVSNPMHTGTTAGKKSLSKIYFRVHPQPWKQWEILVYKTPVGVISLDCQILRVPSEETPYYVPKTINVLFQGSLVKFHVSIQGWYLPTTCNRTSAKFSGGKKWKLFLRPWYLRCHHVILAKIRQKKHDKYHDACFVFGLWENYGNRCVMAS